MEFRKFTMDPYFDDMEVADMFASISRPLEGPDIEPEPRESNPPDNSVSRLEFQSSIVGLMNLMAKLIDSIRAQPAPIVTVTPNVIAQIQPHEKVTTVHRDDMGRITESHSRTE